jgi:hypothetical protein
MLEVTFVHAIEKASWDRTYKSKVRFYQWLIHVHVNFTSIVEEKKQRVRSTQNLIREMFDVKANQQFDRI